MFGAGPYRFRASRRSHEHHRRRRRHCRPVDRLVAGQGRAQRDALGAGREIPNPLAASGDHHRIIRRAYRASTGYGALITEAYEAWREMWGDLGENHLDPTRLHLRFARARRRGGGISRRAGGRRLAVRAVRAGCGRETLAVPGARHVPLRLFLAGRRRAALPQDRGRARRMAAAGMARTSTRTARSSRSTPTAAASSWNPARRCRPTASSSRRARGC